MVPASTAQRRAAVLEARAARSLEDNAPGSSERWSNMLAELTASLQEGAWAAEDWAAGESSGGSGSESDEDE